METEVARGSARTPVPAASEVSAGRGRPRDEDVDARILDAAFDELAAGGISRFSLIGVARRAGVAKGSVYLRWPTREDLILACAQQVVSPITQPTDADFPSQLRTLADQWAATFGRPKAVEVLLRVDADRDENPALFAKVFEHLQGAGNEVFRSAVEKAQARGEIRDDVSAVVVNRIFAGALFVEALAHTPAGSISPEFREDLVRFMLDGLRPHR